MKSFFRGCVTVKNKRNIVAFIVALAIPLAVGGLSAWLTAGDMVLYEFVRKPPLSPPGWLFPLVWTLLYILMGLASYLVYRSDASPFRKKRALWVYAAQLAVNFFWPLIFFGAEAYFAAFLWLVLLCLLVFSCAVLFYHIDKNAGWLLLPYLIWCIFALYLNFGVYLLN